MKGIYGAEKSHKSHKKSRESHKKHEIRKESVKVPLLDIACHPCYNRLCE